jgi:hypothetical protein
MKKLIPFQAFLALVFFASCNQIANDSQKTPQVDTPKKVTSKSSQDVANCVDADGNRQGHWKILNAKTHFPGYSDTSLIEEGDYRDGLKLGVWTYYAPNGEVDTRIEFKEDKPVKTY